MVYHEKVRQRNDNGSEDEIKSFSKKNMRKKETLMYLNVIMHDLICHNSKVGKRKHQNNPIPVSCIKFSPNKEMLNINPTEKHDQ